MALAMVIKAEGGVTLDEIPEENGHQTIHSLVGGWFDCVRSEHYVGYVHDEGLLIGLPVNVLASAMFGQPLVGDCVVLGALNDDGEYDGENHDVPDILLSNKFAFMANAIQNDPEIRSLVEQAVANINLTPQVTALTDEEFDAWLRGE